MHLKVQNIFAWLKNIPGGSPKMKHFAGCFAMCLIARSAIMDNTIGLRNSRVCVLSVRFVKLGSSDWMCG